jgi:pimeloyl-ACP methyl ester carboxylesterase
MPAVLASAFRPDRTVIGERIAFKARDGRRIEGTLWRPAGATGKRGAVRVPTVVYPHGGPTWQAYRAWVPFKQLLAREGFAFLDVDFRGSTGYGREFRNANHDEWGHADAFDMIDAGHWAAAQSWSNGRLGIYGGSYGGYLVLCALVEEPGLWQAGVDLYGDSEIAESFRHGDRPGRLDLGRMMGSPDDPARAEVYRRGSPLYKAERIEAPLLILHGRKDKRVVPLMTEKMVEALTIEGKFHEVHWYDDEGHGWERRENRRDAFIRIRAFLRRHLMDDLEAKPDDDGSAGKADLFAAGLGANDGLEVGPDGTVYFGDTYNSDVWAFSPDGSRRQLIASRDQFGDPLDNATSLVFLNGCLYETQLGFFKLQLGKANETLRNVVEICKFGNPAENGTYTPRPVLETSPPTPRPPVARPRVAEADDDLHASPARIGVPNTPKGPDPVREGLRRW